MKSFTIGLIISVLMIVGSIIIIPALTYMLFMMLMCSGIVYLIILLDRFINGRS